MSLIVISFLFLFFSFSSLKIYRLVLFVFDISTSIFILLIFNLYSWSFYKKIYFFLISLFNFDLSYIIFLFGPYFFISNFFPWFFCKNFIDFQFHYSIQIYSVLFFSIWSLFFWFFNLFVKVIFLFNLTIESKICSCLLIYFLFQFSSLFF